MTLRLKAGNKFGAKRTTVDGMTFASRQEANRYAELKLLQKAGEIRGLVTQMSWHLTVNGCEIGRYVADFDYDERQGDRWVHVTEDAKGFRTPVYKLKKALMLACHGITIRETRAR